MSQSGLSRKQLSVIDDIFAGELDTEAVLKKHNVSPGRYNKWLSDDNFKAHFNRRIEWLNLQSKAMIARYASLAAAKLVALTDSENQETRRKACLDIISLPMENAQKQANPAKGGDIQPENLPPGTATRLLNALAEENF
jgi:hypothetical protein